MVCIFISWMVNWVPRGSSRVRGMLRDEHEVDETIKITIQSWSRLNPREAAHPELLITYAPRLFLNIPYISYFTMLEVAGNAFQWQLTYLYIYIASSGIFMSFFNALISIKSTGKGKYLNLNSPYVLCLSRFAFKCCA